MFFGNAVGANRKDGLQARKGDDVLTRNAYRSLRISLAAVAVLLLCGLQGFAAQTYTVKKGDTLSGIAKKHGTTVAVLQKANGLKSPDIIRTGQILSIPSGSSGVVSSPITYGRTKQDHVEVALDGNFVVRLPKGAQVTVLARENGKFYVKLADGRKGRVDEDALQLVEGGSAPAPSSSLAHRHDIVRTALAFRGARYRRGGESTSGFDCSGFVKYIYGTKGIKLPHDSRAMFGYGKPVAKADLQPGDLVFFANTYRRGISHVGIFIGEGKFIHAATSRRGVRVDQLSGAYYVKHYAGARRL